METPLNELKATVQTYLSQRGNTAETARVLGLARSTTCARLMRAMQAGLITKEQMSSSRVEAVSEKQGLKFGELEQKIKFLTAQNKILERDNLSNEKVKAFIHDVKQFTPVVPKWLAPKRQPGVTGVPILFCSDLHWDEVVDPAQMNGVNAYNRAIAVRRLKRVFSTGIDLLVNHMAKPKYDYSVLALGGDLLSGIIHDELRESNEAPISLSIISLIENLIAGITLMADNFGKVFIPCVVGNHGRWDKKPRFKNRVFENFEWLALNMLARHFAKDDRIHFDIANGADLPFKIYNTRYLLTHGDQARGGSGIAGALSPLMLMDHRKRKRAMATDQGFDLLIMGHWHQYMHVKGMIVNGSLKGADEWTLQNNFDFEVPTQAMWITHPDYAVTAKWPIYAARPGTKYTNRDMNAV